jgi:hypothetical protein
MLLNVYIASDSLFRRTLPLAPHPLCILLLVLCLGLSACSGKGFRIEQLAKSDIDMVSDAVLRQLGEQLKTLTIKFYKRNPRELAKVPVMTVDQRLTMIFAESGQLRFQELGFLQEVDAMNLAFNAGFEGDRVFALMVGLTGMIRQSYNYDSDFYIHEDLDAQKLYNSARNIEVMAWQLKNKKNTQGESLIISSEYKGIVDNLSFERAYGKLINTQDLMTMIIADKDNRAINTVIKGTLSVFLPI